MIFGEEILRRLEALRLAVRRSVQGRREGDRPTGRRGGASDFVAHRTYAQGDDLRAIDWHAYARLGQLFVRERSREEQLVLHLALDLSPSMRGKLDWARRVAAGLAAVALAESGRVVVGSRSYELLPPLLSTLEELDIAESRPRETLARLRRRTRGPIAFFSDLWDEDLRESLLECASDLTVVHVLAPEERLPGEWGRVRLADAETGEELERFVGAEEIARYERLLEEHCESWRRWCFDHAIHYVRCGSEIDWEQVVTVTLREAGVLE